MQTAEASHRGDGTPGGTLMLLPDLTASLLYIIIHQLRGQVVTASP